MAWANWSPWLYLQKQHDIHAVEARLNGLVTEKATLQPCWNLKFLDDIYKKSEKGERQEEKIEQRLKKGTSGDWKPYENIKSIHIVAGLEKRAENSRQWVGQQHSKEVRSKEEDKPWGVWKINN